MRNCSQLLSRICLFVAAALGASAPAAVAQGTLPTQTQCDEAFARAASDVRAAAEEGILGGCGIAGTRLIARAVESSARDSNQDHLMRLRDVSPRSGVIFEAALALSTNSSALPDARVGAMRILATQLLGSGGDLQVLGGMGALARGPQSCFLASQGSGDTTGVDGDPLPADHEARVRTSMEALALASSEDPAVRNGARCIRAHFKPAMTDPLPAGTVRISFECGTQYRITNTGPRPVLLTFEVVGKPGRTNFWSPVGRSLIVADYPGVVRLYYAGQQLGSASSGSIACPVKRAETRPSKTFH